MSFFQRLFSKKKMENQELLEKLLTTSKDFRINDIILREIIPFFKEKAADLGPREFHPWIEEWYTSPDCLEFVYSHFMIDDFSQLSQQRDKTYDFYVSDVIGETLIHEEKYPIEVDQFDPDIKTAYFVTALRIRDIVGNSLPY
ncbi:hypothetical protein [Peribacillus kribbensis]|uniref:hypothetical protein n=1 Tax=Peribacillus kribbensis TaxID=356658 RepID=UPI0004050C6B|nr:hypothetical protein [Peribacillus kribbensis]